MRQKYGVLTILMAFILCVTISSCVACESEEEMVSTLPVVSTSPSTSSPFPTSARVVEPTVVDTGLAYGTPCKPPCWQGLTPGESTRQEASQVLNSLVENGQMVLVTDRDAYFIAFSEATMAEDKVGSAFGRFEENTLVRVSGIVEFYYSIGSLVETFGAPERLTPLNGRRCSSCEEWEPPEPLTAVRRDSKRTEFLYPTQGLWFSVAAIKGGCICPEMIVTSFCYYTPITMQEALTDDYLVDMCEPSLAGLSEKDLVEWHGFGGGY